MPTETRRNPTPLLTLTEGPDPLRRTRRPVVNHVAPAVSAVAAPVALAAPAIYGGVFGYGAALGHVATAAAVVGHAASYAAPLAVAAPLAAPLAVAAPVAYGGV
ncbi:hypothetical protein TNCV_4362721 [Trichonephila clavipes]|nr:hypothetical protein TNCV_4362721 [Trichonephila clavipes]